MDRWRPRTRVHHPRRGTPNGVVFSVFGNHTYAAAGTYPVTVTITKTASGSTAIASSQAVIAGAPLSPGTPVTLNTNSGVLLTNAVLGSFTDVNPAAPIGDFSATIDWGDGTPTSLGTIVQPDGVGTAFDVEGTHTYAAARLLLHADHRRPRDVDGSMGTLTGTVKVTDQTLTGALSYPVAGVENISTGTILLATFNDPNPLDTASGISATVNWGDVTGSFPAFVTLVGTSSTGGSMFEVTGNHIYTTPGIYTVSITATTLGGATTTLSPLTTTATVADAPITASGTSISGIEGNSTGSVVIATFIDADPKSTVADFTTGNGSVKVNWGDGSALQTLPASALTSSGSPDGVLYTVTAAHTYAEAGHDQLTVTITDTDGAMTSANSQATIADAPLSPSATQPTVSTTEAVVSSGPVGSFIDANPSAPTTDYTVVTIDWGDGTPRSAGTISQPGGVGTAFIVSGTHTYADSGVNGGIGHYPITIDVSDVDGVSTTIANTANVADVPLTVAGKLNPASNSDVFKTADITDVDEPNFVGTTNQPGATVSLYATATEVLDAGLDRHRYVRRQRRLEHHVEPGPGQWGLHYHGRGRGRRGPHGQQHDRDRAQPGHRHGRAQGDQRLVQPLPGPDRRHLPGLRRREQHRLGPGRGNLDRRQQLPVHHGAPPPRREVPRECHLRRPRYDQRDADGDSHDQWWPRHQGRLVLLHDRLGQPGACERSQGYRRQPVGRRVLRVFPLGEQRAGRQFRRPVECDPRQDLRASTVVGRGTPDRPPGTRQGKVHVGPTSTPSNQQPKQLSAKERYAHKIASKQAHSSTGSTPAVSSASPAASATPALVDQAVEELVVAKHHAS